MKKPFVLLLLVASAVFSGVWAASVIQRRIPATGTVVAVNVDVFWDAACTQIVTSVNWGVLEPGEGGSATLFVKNMGNAALTLAMTTQSWVPSSASSYISVSWNAEGAIVQPGSVDEVVISLSVSSDISGVADFQFDIVIEGVTA